LTTPFPRIAPANPTARVRRAGVVTVALAGVGVLLAVVVAAAMLWPRDDGSKNSTDLFPVSTTSFDITIVANGELESRTRTEIRSSLEKPVAITYIIPEGTIAEKGDILVQLASEDIKKDIDEEMLRVETARSDLVTAINDYDIQLSENEFELRQARLRLELAEIEYEKWTHGDVVKRRQDIALKIEKAERELRRLDEKFQRSQQLFDQGFLSRDELELDQIRFIEAVANLDTAKLEKMVYEEYEHPKDYKRLTSDIEEARVEIDRVMRRNASRLTSREANRENRGRQLEIREERLAKLKEQYEATTIIAPRSGLVVYDTSTGSGRGNMMMSGDGALQIGKTVRPNERLIILPDTREMVASVRVHEAIAGRIRPGQKARVIVEGIQNGGFAGEVLNIGVLPESGGWRDPNLREFTVKILLEQINDSGLLRPSTSARAEIQLGRVEDVLAVPVQAIFSEGPIRYVYTPRSGRFVRTPVQVGRRSDTLAEVRIGLAEGDRVLLREPRPGEILSTDFDEQALAAVMPAQRGDRPGSTPAATAERSNGAGETGRSRERAAEGGETATPRTRTPATVAAPTE